MAFICPRCHKVHCDGVVSCEQSEQIYQEFLKRVEHHKMHCKDCPDPEAHVRRLDAPKKNVKTLLKC